MPASCPVAATLLGTGSSARGRDPSAPPPPVGGAAKGAPPEAPSSWGSPSWGPAPLARVCAEAPPAWPPVPRCGGWGGSPEGFPAPACLCQNGWWVERGSGVARLEGDSLWEL